MAKKTCDYSECDCIDPARVDAEGRPALDAPLYLPDLGAPRGVVHIITWSFLQAARAAFYLTTSADNRQLEDERR